MTLTFTPSRGVAREERPKKSMERNSLLGLVHVLVQLVLRDGSNVNAFSLQFLDALVPLLDLANHENAVLPCPVELASIWAA